MAIRVSLVEDQCTTRNQFVGLLEAIPTVRVRSVHRTAEDALKSLPVREIDLALVDIVLPRMSGIELVRELKQRRPSVLALMLTIYDDAEKIFDSLAAGADGYILKTSSAAALQAKIEEAIHGGSALSPSVARKIIQYFRRKLEPREDLAGLTGRELTVLREVARGHTYKEAGNALGISTETVRAHIRNIKGKLHVGTRGQAVAKFLSGRP